MLDKWFTNIFSQVFAFALTIGIALKKKNLAQQWICLFMEKLMFQISSQ